MNSKRLSHAIAGLILASVMVPSAAGAQALTDKYWLDAAVFFPNIESAAAITSTTQPGVGTSIDFESDLDLSDRDTQPAILAGARLGGGWSLVGEYYSLGREGTKTIDHDIVFDGVTYPANGSVTGALGTDVYRLSVGYAFLRSPNYELGVSLGAHVTNFDVSLSGQGRVGNTALSSQVRQETVLAPMPTIGMYGTVQVMPGLTAGARFDWLSLGYDKYDGELLNAQASLMYRVTRNIGLGVLYRIVDYNLTVTEDNWIGQFNYNFHGPSVFVEIGF